ncbi:MAG: heme o synthase [Planctomycetota bacterium]
MSEVMELAVGSLTHSARSRASAVIELCKPRVSAMVLAATAVGFFMALSSPLDLRLSLLLFNTVVGTALVAAGANAINQYMEADFDARMERTASRPIPSGRLSRGEALAFGLSSAVFGVAGLWALTGLVPAMVAATTFVTYVSAYTPLKRVTPLCVFVGAVPGALPPVIGWTAAGGTLDVGAFLLFSIVYFWQLPHFAAIAWQHREDYARGGYPMLAVLDGDGSRTMLHVVTHSVGLVSASVLPFVVGIAGSTYAVGAVLLGLAFFGSGCIFLSQKTPRAARIHVLASVVYLPLLLGLMLFDRV